MTGEHKWGVFDRRDSFDKTVHVAPCDADGMITGGHRVLIFPCNPRQEQYGEFKLMTHREES